MTFHMVLNLSFGLAQIRMSSPVSYHWNKESDCFRMSSPGICPQKKNIAFLDRLTLKETACILKLGQAIVVRVLMLNFQNHLY